VDAGEDLDERRFPRAVLAHEPDDLAAVDIERHVVEGPQARERLRQVPDFEED
jgi:hypothetical protein